MFRRKRLTALAFFALVAFPAHAIAQQEDMGPFILTTPPALRADEIVIDAERDSIILRGSIDWPDGRTTTSVVLGCSGNSLMVLDLELKTDDRWRVDPDYCKLLARRVQPRK